MARVGMYVTAIHRHFMVCSQDVCCLIGLHFLIARSTMCIVGAIQLVSSANACSLHQHQHQQTTASSSARQMPPTLRFRTLLCMSAMPTAAAVTWPTEQVACIPRCPSMLCLQVPTAAVAAVTRLHSVAHTCPVVPRSGLHACALRSSSSSPAGGPCSRRHGLQAARPSITCVRCAQTRQRLAQLRMCTAVAQLPLRVAVKVWARRRARL